MGYMRHHAIVVTTWDAKKINAARDEAVRLGNVCTLVCPSPSNGYQSFLVVPDGSKEGWPESDKGDGARAAFIGWLSAQDYEDGSSPYDWVEVVYGAYVIAGVCPGDELR